MVRFLVFLFVVFNLGICVAPSAEASNEQASFVVALLKSKCAECHAGSEPSGGFNLADLEPTSGDKGKRDKQWARVFHVLVTAQMPPVDAEQLTRIERAKVIAALQDRLQDSGLITEWQRKLLFPEYGNYVDHESLFDGSVTDLGWSPSRLWKKSPHIFDSLANRGMGFRPGRYGARSAHLAKLKQPFTMEDKAGVKDFAAVTLADSATLGTMLRNAETLVDNILREPCISFASCGKVRSLKTSFPKTRKASPSARVFRPRPPNFRQSCWPKKERPTNRLARRSQKCSSL